MESTTKKTKLPEVEYLVLCDHAFTTSDNKLSIIGVFEKIFLRNLPAHHPRMFIVGVINGNPGDLYTIQLKITAPSGKVVVDQSREVKLGPNGRTNLLIDFVNFPISEVGTFNVSLEFSGRVLRMTGLEAVKLSEPIKQGRNVRPN